MDKSEIVGKIRVKATGEEISVVYAIEMGNCWTVKFAGIDLTITIHKNEIEYIPAEKPLPREPGYYFIAFSGFYIYEHPIGGWRRITDSGQRQLSANEFERLKEQHQLGYLKRIELKDI